MNSNEKRTQKGAPMATLQDIADRLNISKGTVSKALNGAPDTAKLYKKPYWKQLLKWDIQKSAARRLRRKNSVF